MVANNLLWHGQSSRNALTAIAVGGLGSRRAAETQRWPLIAGGAALQPSSRPRDQITPRSRKDTKSCSAQPPCRGVSLQAQWGRWKLCWLCFLGVAQRNSPKDAASHEPHPDQDAQPCNDLGWEGGCKTSMLCSQRLFPKSLHCRTHEGITAVALGQRASRPCISEQITT